MQMVSRDKRAAEGLSGCLTGSELCFQSVTVKDRSKMQHCLTIFYKNRHIGPKNGCKCCEEYAYLSHRGAGQQWDRWDRAKDEG